MALKEFRLPDIGEGIAEGEIVSWKVQEGQQVKEEDEFVEVMTDKATVMITVPFDGTIKELKVKEGDVVPVESVIAVIDTAGGGGGAAPAKEEKKEPAPAKREPEPEREIPRAEKPAPESHPERPRAPEPPAPQRREPEPEPVGAHARGDGGFQQAEPGKVLAAPATRKRAREMGIDLHGVEGTGPRGRVTNDDLQKHLESGAPAREAAPQRQPEAAPAAERAPAAAAAQKITPPRGKVSVARTDREERIPFRGLRRKIAEAMSRSKQTAAHFTYVDDIDVTALVELRKQAKAEFQDKGVNVTYLPFVMKAVVEAHKQFPSMNSSLDESTDELVIKHYYNFGIATDTTNGLIVPVVKDVDRKSIAELAQDIQELAQKTREGTIAVDDLQGGTFTITNAGNIGGLFATPVINFPEVSILGVHAIKDTPVVRDGRIQVGKVMYLSVSIDHRLVDGATGARWMNVVKECLENPNRLLLGRI